MARCTLTLALLCVCLVCFAQSSAVDPSSITIVRDSLGVPHIYAPTDAATAYGLAWAHCEDDFRNIQINLLNARGRLGEVLGKEGAIFDYFYYLTGLDTVVRPGFREQFSPDFLRVLDGYVAGCNAYAKAHPSELLVRNLLPFTAEDVIRGYVLELSLMQGMGQAAFAIFKDRVERMMNPNFREGGSNSMAIGPNRTPEGVPYLLANSHQPMEGRFAWYEAHLVSDEGTNILGATFPGGVTLFIGTNERLGWTHTVNYHNFGDVYRLTINPRNKNEYLYNGQWLPLRRRRVKLKVKVAGIKLGVRRWNEASLHGPVIRRKHGVYALRTAAPTELRAAEQWWRMNKARNLQEFNAALQLNRLALFNVMYADVDGNIHYSSQGLFPNRDSTLNWHQPVPGDSSAYVWQGLMPYDQRPIVENPSCGYLYNANNTPLHCTCPAENPHVSFPGLQTFEYNRGERFAELLQALDGQPITWEDFLRIKYDDCYATEGRYVRNFGVLFSLQPTSYPAIADAIRHLQAWDHCHAPTNPHAALAMLTHHYIEKLTGWQFGLQMILDERVTEETAVKAIEMARRFLLKHYNRLDVPLGAVLRHERGSVSLPTGGGQEVPFAIHIRVNEKRGVVTARGGETYVQLVKFHSSGPEIWAANCYGASARPNSPHYTDQMPDFVARRTRPRSLSWQHVRQSALRTYHPGQ